MRNTRDRLPQSSILRGSSVSSLGCPVLLGLSSGGVGRGRRQHQAGEPGRGQFRTGRFGAVKGAHRSDHVRPHALPLRVLAADVALWYGAVELPALDTDIAKVRFVPIKDVTGLSLQRRHKSRTNGVRAAVRSLRHGDPKGPGGRRRLLRWGDSAAGRDGHDRQCQQDSQCSEEGEGGENVDQLLHGDLFFLEYTALRLPLGRVLEAPRS